MKAIEKAWEVSRAEATRLYDAGQPPALNDLVPIVVTAFLDAILEDPEAMERVKNAMNRVIGRSPQDYAIAAIKALKQEAER